MGRGQERVGVQILGGFTGGRETAMRVRKYRAKKKGWGGGDGRMIA